MRNLAPSPSSAAAAAIQSPVLGYHKYYQPNMNVNQLGGSVTPPMGQNLARSRAAGSNVVQHMQTTGSGRVSFDILIGICFERLMF